MLKIKDGVDLKELEKFGFVYYYDIRKNNDTPKFYNGFETYTEKGYRWSDNINTINIVEKRKNANWCFECKERELDIHESDYEMGVSPNIGDILFDLIKADMVEKVVEE